MTGEFKGESRITGTYHLGEQIKDVIPGQATETVNYRDGQQFVRDEMGEEIHHFHNVVMHEETKHVNYKAEEANIIEIVKPKYIDLVVENPVENRIYVDKEVIKRVEVPITKVVEKEVIKEIKVEVPVTKVVEEVIEKRVEVPVEKIIEEPVYVEEIVEVPRFITIEEKVDQPYEVYRDVTEDIDFNDIH